MHLQTLTTLLITTSATLISAASSLPPGIHNIGDPCTKAQRGTFGCPPDGSQVLFCSSNLLSLDNILPGKSLKGQSWGADGSCTDEAENFFGTCMCDEEGMDCKCVDANQ